MTDFRGNQKNYRNVILGILLIIVAIQLGKTEVYTSIKGLVLGIGGSVTLAICIAIGMIILAFSSGVYLLRRS